MKLHALIGVLVVACGGVVAATDSVSDKVSLADQLLRAGDYGAAERLLKAALGETDPTPREDSRRAALLNNLGFVYQLAGNYDQAETCLKRAVDLHTSSPEPNELRVAISMGNLAKLYVENGQFAKAERLGLRSIADRVERIEPFSAELARILGSLGVVERHRQNHQTAEQYHRRALAVWEKRAPAGSEVVETLNNLGLVYMESGRDKEALKCFEVALEHVKTGRAAAPTVAVTLLANAGSLQFRLNGPGPAEPYYRRAAAVAHESVGQSHRLTGRILANYAVVLRQLQRKTEARDMEKRAKAIFASGASGVSDRYSVDVSTLRVR